MIAPKQKPGGYDPPGFFVLDRFLSKTGSPSTSYLFVLTQFQTQNRVLLFLDLLSNKNPADAIRRVFSFSSIDLIEELRSPESL